MAFDSPNQYFQTHTAQTGNVSQIYSRTNQDWFSMMQPWYDTLNNWYQQNQAMARQTQGQEYEVGKKIPAETAAASELARLQQQLMEGAPLYKEETEGKRKANLAAETQEEATARRAAELGLTNAQAGGIMPWPKEFELGMFGETEATKRAGISAGGKANADNPSEIVWSFLKDNLPVSHSEWVKDAQGNWSLEAVRADPKKIEQVVSEFEGTAGLLYKPDQVKNMSATLRKILTTGEAPDATVTEDATNLAKVAGIEQGAAVKILKAAYEILNAPFAALIDMTKIALFTPASKQREAVKNWLNTYLPGRIGDKMYPTQTPTLQPAPGSKPFSGELPKGLPDLYKNLTK